MGKELGRRDNRPHLDLFEDFGDGFTVEFLTGLLVGGEDLLQRHVVSCEKTEHSNRVSDDSLHCKQQTHTRPFISMAQNW